MTKYTAEQVEDMANAKIIPVGSVIAEILRAYAADLREREGMRQFADSDAGKRGLIQACLVAANEGQGATPKSMRSLLAQCAKFLERENTREAAKGGVTDEVFYRARDAYNCKQQNMLSYADDTALRDALEAVLPMVGKPAVPDGWKLVPTEPTERMVDAGTAEHECEQGDSWYSSPSLSDRDCKAIYKAMLSAAPTPPASEEMGE